MAMKSLPNFERQMIQCLREPSLPVRNFLKVGLKERFHVFYRKQSCNYAGKMRKPERRTENGGLLFPSHEAGRNWRDPSDDSHSSE